MKGLKASGKRGKEGESSREGEPTGWRKGGWRGWRVCGYVWAWVCRWWVGLCVWGWFVCGCVDGRGAKGCDMQMEHEAMSLLLADV